MRVSANTQINRLSLPELPRRARDHRDAGAHGWQIQLTVAMGRAADEPECCCSRATCSSCSRCSARSKTRCDAARRALLAGQQHRLLRPVRVDAARRRCRAGTSRRAARARDARHRGRRRRSRAARRCRPRPGPAATSASTRCATSGSAPRRCATRATAPSTDLWGFCRTCYYADVCRAGCTWTSTSCFGRAGQQPVLPPPRARAEARGQARAHRPGRGRAGHALRPRALRDRRRGRSVAARRDDAAAGMTLCERGAPA